MVANIIFYDFPLGYFNNPEADTLYIISMISHVDLKPRPSFTVLSAAATIPHTLGQSHVNVTRFFFIYFAISDDFSKFSSVFFNTLRFEKGQKNLRQTMSRYQWMSCSYYGFVKWSRPDELRLIQLFLIEK